MKTNLRLLLFTVILLCSVLPPTQAAPTFGVLANFSASTGNYPSAGLVQGKDGNFYGTTAGGGTGDYGTVFRLTPTGGITTLFSFSLFGPEGSSPSANLIEGKDGNFYGTTYDGGKLGFGTVFKITSSGVLTTLISFAGTDGAYPRSGLLQGSDGNFYGTTPGDLAVSNNSGTIYKLTPSGVLTPLVIFSDSEGGLPLEGLVEGNDGYFYGTTYFSGTSNMGSVYKISPSGTLTNLVSFNGTDGGNPWASVTKGIDGNFYGTTVNGGGHGTIFRLTSAGVLTQLAKFNGTNGEVPESNLIQAKDGNFYGTTKLGGTAGKGTVFKVTPAGTLTSLVSFNGSNGSSPAGSLIEGKDGNLYGTTTSGGTEGKGVVFEIALQPPQAQTITFPPVGTAVFTQTVKLTATASSGLPITYKVLSGPATVSGNEVSFNGAATVKLAADQAGNLNFKAANEVAINVSVKKLSQSIAAFDPIPAHTYGDAPFAISPPRTSSGLSATVSVKSGPATISRSRITIKGAGAVTLLATQAGNANIAAAASVSTSFLVNKALQTITFPAVGTVTHGQTVTLGATASSGLPVTYTVLSGSATIAGNKVTFTTAGTVRLAAKQAGSSNFAAAKTVAINVAVK